MTGGTMNLASGARLWIGAAATSYGVANFTVGSGGGGSSSGSIALGSPLTIPYSPYVPSPPPDYGNLDITVANAQDVAATAEIAATTWFAAFALAT